MAWLEQRYGASPGALRERIAGETDLDRLLGWWARAPTIEALDELGL